MVQFFDLVKLHPRWWFQLQIPTDIDSHVDTEGGACWRPLSFFDPPPMLPRARPRTHFRIRSSTGWHTLTDGYGIGYGNREGYFCPYIVQIFQWLNFRTRSVRIYFQDRPVSL